MQQTSNKTLQKTSDPDMSTNKIKFRASTVVPKESGLPKDLQITIVRRQKYLQSLMDSQINASRATRNGSDIR
jgi:hypothetical protein